MTDLRSRNFHTKTISDTLEQACVIKIAEIHSQCLTVIIIIVCSCGEAAYFYLNTDKILNTFILVFDTFMKMFYLCRQIELVQYVGLMQRSGWKQRTVNRREVSLKTVSLWTLLFCGCVHPISNDYSRCLWCLPLPKSPVCWHQAKFQFVTVVSFLIRAQH